MYQQVELNGLPPFFTSLLRSRVSWHPESIQGIQQAVWCDVCESTGVNCIKSVYQSLWVINKFLHKAISGFKVKSWAVFSSGKDTVSSGYQMQQARDRQAAIKVKPGKRRSCLKCHWQHWSGRHARIRWHWSETWLGLIALSKTWAYRKAVDRIMCSATVRVYVCDSLDMEALRNEPTARW